MSLTALSSWPIYTLNQTVVLPRQKDTNPSEMRDVNDYLPRYEREHLNKCHPMVLASMLTIQ